MNKILIVLFATLAAFVVCEEKVARSYGHGYGNGYGNGYGHGHGNNYNCCPKVCQNCGVTKVNNYWWNGCRNQRVEKRIVLKCTPGSYFEEIRICSSMRQNVGCTGIEQVCDNSARIEGVVCGSHNVVPLNGKRTVVTTTRNEGNVQELIHRNLNSCSCCDCDDLLSITDYTLYEPVIGCCAERSRSNRAVADYGRVEIHGKCCSTCFLQKGDLKWEHCLCNKWH